MLNMDFIKVVNDQHLFKMLLGPLQTSWQQDAYAWAQKYFQVLGLGLDFFFFEVLVSTLDHQNFTASLVDNKIENF